MEVFICIYAACSLFACFPCLYVDVMFLCKHVCVCLCVYCRGALEPEERYGLRVAEGDLVNYQDAASASSPED